MFTRLISSQRRQGTEIIFKVFLRASVSLWLILLLSGCAKEPQNRVVLYCSVDDVYARPIIAELERKTGLKIDVLYDVESAKTAGLANRIRAEKNRPRADVFWSSALLQTLLLKREGLLQKYSSPSAKDISDVFKDKEGFWAGMGVRARVIMFSAIPHEKNLIHMYDKNLYDKNLLDAFYKNKVGISNPQFGTASDWAAALCTRWGKAKTLEYFRVLKKNGVHVLPGNSVVADKIARGELFAGVTDSDDYYATMNRSNQKFGGNKSGDDAGTLIPGSVALMKSAPHKANARRLADALISVETENMLRQQMPGLASTRGFSAGQVPANGLVFPLHDETIPNDTDKWAAAWDEIREPLAQILLSD